ncbi:MAG: hypothetical protein WC829_01915 [Hyphomicrobium sp.]|jgi:hypothetical protein
MFDSHKFLTSTFGSADQIVGLLTAYSIAAPPKDTVRKWFERSGVPAAWLPVLLVVLEMEHGSPVKLVTYMSEGANGQ